MSSTSLREISALPSPLRLYGAALLTSRKRNAPAELPALSLARPAVTLEAAHIDRYAKICGFRPEQGVPLTYPHMLAFPLHMLLMADVRFPWSMMGMVHLANTVRQHARLTPGQTGRIEVSLIRPQAHDKGQVFCLQSRLLAPGESAACLWESESLYLRTGIRTPAGPAYESTLNELTLQTPTQTWHIEAAMGRHYGFMSGDLNPIHLNRLAALAFGFPRPIAHGMWTKAHALAALMPAHPIDVGMATVEFKTPLFLPGKATLWVESPHPPHPLPPAPEGEQRFEVRDGHGEKPHLRGCWQAKPC